MLHAWRRLVKTDAFVRLDFLKMDAAGLCVPEVRAAEIPFYDSACCWLPTAHKALLGAVCYGGCRCRVAGQWVSSDVSGCCWVASGAVWCRLLPSQMAAEYRWRPWGVIYQRGTFLTNQSSGRRPSVAR